MELRNAPGVVLIILFLFMILGTSAFVLEKYKESIDPDILSYSENTTTDNGTETTLTYTPVTLSATRKNRTWLEFGEGTTDVVNGSWQQAHQYNLSHSFSLWFNTSSNFTDRKILLYSNALEGIEAIEGNLSYYLMGPSLFIYLNSTTNTLNNSNWHHIAVTFNATDDISNEMNMTLWIDGTAEATVEAGNVSVSTDTTLAIGNLTDSWIGGADEFRWYNVTLSDAEVLAIYNSGRTQASSMRNYDLVAWLPMNENTGINMHTFNSTLDSQTLLESRTGTSWANDDISVALTSGTHYTLLNNIFTIINLDVAWTQIVMSYAYEWDSSVQDVFDDLTGEIESNTSIAGMVLTISLIGIVLSILIGIFYIFTGKRGL